MTDYNRRSFLKLSGAALGGIAVGSTVTAAASDRRFLLDSKRTTAAEAEAASLDVVYDLPEIDLLVVDGAESDVESLGTNYAADSRYSLDLPLEAESPITVGDAGETADEPYYPLQWDKQSQNIAEAHEVTRGEGTRVSVIDSGVAAGHPDLRNVVNEELSRDFTGDGYGAGGPYGGYHGTHVAGIVAADDRNDAGVVGSAPGTELVDCRVFSPTKDASFADTVAAIVYSARIGCDAANLSLGAYPIPRTGLGKFYGKVLNRTMAYARNQGTVVVVAAGNDAADLQHDGGVISLPNEAANVISVSATGPIGFGWGDEGLKSPTYTPAKYTNYGTNAIDLAAPGGNYDADAIGTDAPWYHDLVFNTLAKPQFDDDDNYLGAEYTYSWLAGTSMAAPQVAGAVALVRGQAPDLNANRVRKRLRNSATVPGEFDKTYYGAGVLNPDAALE